MNSFLILFNDVVRLYIWVLVINAVASWLVAFNVINTSNRFVYSVLEISHKLTDPPLRFIRNFMPNLGTVDISPIVLILGLIFLRNFINEIFYKIAL
jgi:YggT family protein